MAMFPEAAPTSAMETSSFAHVIFQNVGKSFLPHAPLECRYTLTPFIKPHRKDWVGIFKVGWTTARDYFTFLWSPYPENHVEGTAVNRAVVFQGYYVPKDDGEFYQFCYVTHKGEIRGASTPFQFHADTPTDDDLLTVEDEGNSDILVVTTKSGMLEQKVEEAEKEKEELLKAMGLLQKEKEQLQEEREHLQKVVEQEKLVCAQLQQEKQELQQSCSEVQSEVEEVRKQQDGATVRVRQLEEDLVGVTQRGLEKETELDGLRDRLKKLTAEKENSEAQLKNEREEKELYKVHLKSTELENTKLTAELQMLKSVDVNKGNTIAQLQEELARVKACAQERERLQKEAPQDETASLKEQLRQTEERLQATRQQASMLGAEVRDAASARDRTMTELYRTRVEADSLKAKCGRLEGELEKLKPQQGVEEASVGGASSEKAELRREVEELKLRLQLAAEHYTGKYKECQKLRKQVAKLADQQGDVKKSPGEGADAARPESPASPMSASVDILLSAVAQDKLDKKFKRGSSEDQEELEGKLREQCRISETLKQQLSEAEQRYKSCIAEKEQELRELKESFVQVVREKVRQEEELQKCTDPQAGEAGAVSHSGRAPPVFLQFPLPYPQEPPPTSLVQQRPAELQYGNPYSTPQTPGGADGEFSPEHIARPPTAGPGSWDSNVVCIQPARTLSPPEGLEDPEEHSNVGGERELVQEPRGAQTGEGPHHFCFDPSIDIHKRCPLCEVIFPPHYEQSKFEEHVESHWKVCPMCSEQFPPDCDQQVFERHVLTHFDGNVLNFD